MMHRLKQRPDEWLDRKRGGTFRFEAREIPFIEGDTYSTALAAAGLMVLARSFKYHRPRGIFSAANFDANVLFDIDGRPNQRGDVLRARDGAIVKPCNVAGSVEHDRGALIGSLSRFLPVGFYYKTFISRRWFPLFESLIRRVSGLGRISPGARATQPMHRHLHCDVAIVGAGVSGLAAAMAAATAGADRIVLIDEGQEAGGCGLHGSAADGLRRESIARLRAQVGALPGIVCLQGHCAFGLYEDLRVGVVDITRPEGGALMLRASSVVLATGSVEQPIVFRNGDLPGILLASAAQRLLYRWSIACGREIVVLAATAEGADAALDLAAAGIHVSTFAWLSGSAPLADPLRSRLVEAGIRLIDAAVPLQAIAGRHEALAAVELRVGTRTERIACDALLLAAGSTPSLALALQAGGTQRWSNGSNRYLPHELPRGVLTAGRASGCHDFSARLADGARAGAAAAAGDFSAPDDPADAAPDHPAPFFPHPLGKEFVDLDEDLTLGDLSNAIQEGFDSTELMKRYSTVGMGPSQGKLSNLNAARYLAASRGVPFEQLSLTTARPPWQGVTLGALAGEHEVPLRRSALDAVHAAAGAQWMPAGPWRRPAWYARAGRSRLDCIAAEVQAVRQRAGIIDVSTLGKIELHGIDAVRLLERMYLGRYADQREGTTRYAVMVDDAGMIIDDGVVARRGEHAWYVTATTGAAAAVYREMQRMAIERGLDVVLHNLTGAMAAINLAGPQSREILAQLCTAPIDAAAFPYLAYRELMLERLCLARVLRAGFVGELAYEIHVPFDQAVPLWNRLVEASGAAGLAPFGVEAQRTLRLEKGHLIVGQDTDALTSPDEAGLGRAVRMEKPEFTGRRSIEALRRRGPRQQLVGFVLDAPTPPFSECNLIIGPDGPCGRVTSVAASPTLGHALGMALVSPALAGQPTFSVLGDDGRMHEVRRAPTPFYDPGNTRQREADRR